MKYSDKQRIEKIYNNAHFWKKNDFIIIDEVIRNGFPIVIAEKKI